MRKAYIDVMSKNKNEIDENEILKNLIADFSTGHQQEKIDAVKEGKLTKKQFLIDISAYINDEYGVDDKDLIRNTAILFYQYFFGYFRLTPLIDDPDISDIHCLAYDNIRIKKNGVRCSTNIKFASEAEFENFINYVAIKNEVTITNMNAIQRFADNHSNDKFILRFTVCIGLVTAEEKPYLVIRKTFKDFYELPTLVNDKDMMSQDVADDLVKRYNSGSMLICGSNSSGKTTLLNALSETIPDDMCAMFCQQVDELSTKKHPDSFFMHEVPPIGESKICYDLKEISIQGLTMDIDYFVIGEIKGGEAWYLLNAAYTGQICSGTIHSNDAHNALKKLTDYALYNSKYTRNELLEMVANSFKTIVFMKNFKVYQVLEVQGWDYERNDVKYKTIFDRKG